MFAVEFQASVQNGLIEIPDKYKSEFEKQKNVKVILLKVIEELPEDNTGDNILVQLLRNPLAIDDFTPLRRDEIYEQ